MIEESMGQGGARSREGKEDGMFMTSSISPKTTQSAIRNHTCCLYRRGDGRTLEGRLEEKKRVLPRSTVKKMILVGPSES